MKKTPLAPLSAAFLGVILAAAPLPSPSGGEWTALADRDGASFGATVACAGDVDGDGYSDIIVGAPDYDDGTIHGGRVYVYYGDAAGFRPEPWIADGNQGDWEAFGASVAGAGDVNKDGCADIIIGAPGFNGVNSNNCGKVFVYLGGPGGLESSPIWTKLGSEAFQQYGSSVAGVGDVNKDGYADVMIGARYYPHYDPSTGTGKGGAWVYHGGPSGLGSTQAWFVASNGAGLEYGSCVAGIGDVDGDGFDDVAVGAPGRNDPQASPTQAGLVYVYYGSASGVSQAQAWHIHGTELGELVGASVACAGDVDGDGHSDVIVGAPGFNNRTGAARLYSSRHLPEPMQPAEETWTATGSSPGDLFGMSVCGAGDFRGDPAPEILVGAPGAAFGVGAAYVYGTFDGPSQPTWSAQGTAPGARFGCSVASAGDVNGDGADIVIGASGGGPGSVRVVFGGNAAPTAPAGPLQFQLDGVSALPTGATTIQFGFTASVPLLSDYNGDHLRLQVDVEPVTTAFSDPPAHPVSGPVVASGSAASVVVTGLSPSTAYHWRVRAVDEYGAPSGWTSFASNEESQADLVTLGNVQPTLAQAGQVLGADGAAIAVGASIPDETPVFFRATLADGNAEPVRIEVEVRELGAAFTGQATAAGTWTDPGQVAGVASMLAPGRYHWRARAVDATGGVAEWSSFGGNEETAADFVISRVGSRGPASCTHSAAAGGGWILALFLLAFASAATRGS